MQKWLKMSLIAVLATLVLAGVGSIRPVTAHAKVTSGLVAFAKKTPKRTYIVKLKRPVKMYLYSYGLNQRKVFYTAKRVAQLNQQKVGGARNWARVKTLKKGTKLSLSGTPIKRQKAYYFDAGVLNVALPSAKGVEQCVALTSTRSFKVLNSVKN
ncbi:hypothetical protein [Levilactobacillus acidifarinae]|uniref:Uncharacterized protein n=1 Tax=Levilactobacillus acidifarinae DSM 19394 = JCM 15949 TaxID=1423715 RepID=A0A0R1LGP4_9LACO|nr:hypothetical protein [Levilactobacillus acidifarinae]KRK95054.1 hypothetical protein FD25_GL002241 [Levilactobacillus acidifarinae DSM 19394]GEO70783.1 hypothetical protein LAC03_26930 [Levilactobacillus acidifarinae]